MKMIPKVICTPNYPIVDTKQGKLHGYQKNEVFHFLGIPYGEADRFQLPHMMKSWEGVRNAKAYGHVCPLLLQENHEEETLENTFEMPHRIWPASENCLYLNVWTKCISRSGKKPVMVWFHGGGYATGSSVEMYSYDGYHLCDYGDVVVVTVNHRLNCLGYLDLSCFGEKYQYSGCIGMADLILALEWVHENIEGFGGDPDNVTIFGQSGGGSKVLTLMQMPAADGLYHKVIVESGASEGIIDMTFSKCKRRMQELGEKTAEYLGLAADTISRIETVPYKELAEASVKAGQALGRPSGLMLFEPSPVEDYYIGSYDFAGMREEVKAIPILAGTTLGEFSFAATMGDKSGFTEHEKRKRIWEQYGEHTEEVLRLFKKAYSEKDSLYCLGVDAMLRRGTQKLLAARNRFTDAPVYNYVFSVTIPYMGGTLPWHCAEIPFVFRNVEMEPAQCCGYEYADRLTEEISGAWVNFAWNGNPGTETLPWECYTTENPMVMYFDSQSCCCLEKDKDLIEEIHSMKH